MFSIISLTSATPVLLAASISTTSILLSLSIEIQFLHFPQGSGFLRSKFSQLSVFAKMRAIVVFPMPLVPENKNA